MSPPRLYPADLLERLSDAVDPEDGRLTSAAKVRALIGSPESDDSTMNDLIDRATTAIVDWCGLAVAVNGGPATFAAEQLRATWYEQGRCLLPRLALPWRLPLVEVASVVEDGDTLEEGADFAIVGTRPGILLRLSDGVPVPWSSTQIVIEFAAGFEALPSGELEGAAIDQVKYLYKAGPRDPSLRSVELPDIGTKTFNVSGGDTITDRLMPEVCRALGKWKNWL